MDPLLTGQVTVNPLGVGCDVQWLCRNQAPTALLTTLMKYSPEAAAGITALIAWTKQKFNCDISAVQGKVVCLARLWSEWWVQ